MEFQWIENGTNILRVHLGASPLGHKLAKKNPLRTLCF